jgi:hypothetical protein
VKIKRLSDLFSHTSKSLSFIAIALSILSGFSVAFLVPLILYIAGRVTNEASSSLSNGSFINAFSFNELALLFGAYCLLIIVVRSVSEIVIVVSHDDRYFKYADQMVTMEDGAVKDGIIN